MEKLIRSTKKISYIDENGNISYIDSSDKICLAREEIVDGKKVIKKLSKDYYSMEPIYEEGLKELYIVCNAVCDIVYSQFLEYLKNFDDLKFSFKYGIIEIQRDEKGNIIPMGEKVVVPLLYDKIVGNNLESVTAYVNNHLTYIDINPNSDNYGKQLVPAVFEHAVPFSVDYEGFAECSVCGTAGYLPRNCQPRTTLSPLDLLTEEQVEYLLADLESSSNDLNESAVNKYSELTGNAKTLKITKK